MNSVRGRISVRNVLLVLLFSVGLVIFAYPFVSNWYYQTQAHSIIEDYDNAAKQGDAQDFQKDLEKARAANVELVGQTVPDVFAIREGTTDEEYESCLNILGNGMMGYVDIPAISVHLPIYHYSTEESLEKGCGHIFGSSLPVGGESTHTVLTAHRGLPAAEMFTNLDQLRNGDTFFIKVLNQKLAYEVDHIEVVQPWETRSLAIDRGSDFATLVTCTPYGVNTERLLVRGHRVPYVEGDENAATDARPFWLLVQIGVAAAGVALALLLVWLYSRLRRRRAKAAQVGAKQASLPESSNSDNAGRRGGGGRV